MMRMMVPGPGPTRSAQTMIRLSLSMSRNNAKNHISLMTTTASVALPTMPPMMMVTTTTTTTSRTLSTEQEEVIAAASKVKLQRSPPIRHQIRHLRVPLLLSSQYQTSPHQTRVISDLSTPPKQNEEDTKQQQEQQQQQSLSELRDLLGRKIIQQYVPELGWTTKAVTSAILNDDDQKMRLSMTGMFATPSVLVNWFMGDLNHRLRITTQQSLDDRTNHRPTDRLYDVLKWRLEQVIPLAESGQWHHAMAIGLSTPETTRSQLDEFLNIAMIASSTSYAADTADAVTTGNTYFRTALGTIFVATELHLLACAEAIGRNTTTRSSSSPSSDTDSRYAETWSFLRQRLDELDNVAGTGDLNLNVLASSIVPVMSSVSTDIMKVVTGAVIGGTSSSRSSTNPTHTGSGASTDIVMKATSAVATSLFEGFASLVLPNSFLTKQGGSNGNSSGNGTRAEDYNNVPSSR